MGGVQGAIEVKRRAGYKVSTRWDATRVVENGGGRCAHGTHVLVEAATMPKMRASAKHAVAASFFLSSMMPYGKRRREN